MELMRKLSYLPSLLPSLLYAIPLLIVYAAWGHRWRWDRDAWMFELRAGSWFYRVFYHSWGGTTLGHVIMLAPDPSDRIKIHELKHVEQFDSQGFAGLVLAAILVAINPAAWVWALGVWTAAPALIYVTAGIIAVLRGESFYRGNHHEEAAYATALDPALRQSCRRRVS